MCLHYITGESRMEQDTFIYQCRIYEITSNTNSERLGMQWFDLLSTELRE